ncbi:hypothetical protein TNCV_1762891 [Trichonephila clavipes]|nr:hypothetical protein TNCV_1762891 [Trichonephila clavipes]
MHWRHRFPMLFIKLSDTGIGSEDQTQSKLVSANDLGGGFKAATFAKIVPKMFYRIQVGDRAGHSIRSKTVPQILLNNLGRALSSIKMKSLPIAAA